MDVLGDVLLHARLTLLNELPFVSLTHQTRHSCCFYVQVSKSKRTFTYISSIHPHLTLTKTSTPQSNHPPTDTPTSTMGFFWGSRTNIGNNHFATSATWGSNQQQPRQDRRDRLQQQQQQQTQQYPPSSRRSGSSREEQREDRHFFRR